MQKRIIITRQTGSTEEIKREVRYENKEVAGGGGSFPLSSDEYTGNARESLQYLENWQEYVDKGIEKLNELSDMLKEKGMTLALDHFSGKINDYVNENAPFKIEEGYETKIVPVVTVGSKGYIGAAQICGPKEQLDKCKAALTVEGQLASGTVRVQYLVPIDTAKPTSLENVHRVQGVGVSARLDLGFPG